MDATETHRYVTGGEGHGIKAVICMERYDPAVNLWSFVLPMNFGKGDACAVELEEINNYVIGRINGYNTLRQCEAYDVETHQWNLAKGKLIEFMKKKKKKNLYVIYCDQSEEMFVLLDSGSNATQTKM